MHETYLLLYLIAVVLFVLAACNVPSRINLVALGLAFAFVVPLLVELRAMHG